MNDRVEKFTPAPWRVEGKTVYALEHHGWRKGVETFSNRFSVHVQGTDSTPREEQIANAHLIAASPRLYEQLKRAIAWIDSREPFDIREAEDTLAAARGERP